MRREFGTCQTPRPFISTGQASTAAASAPNQNTLALYRGIALIILGSNTISDFPVAYTSIGVTAVPHTNIPWSVATARSGPR